MTDHSSRDHEHSITTGREDAPTKRTDRMGRVWHAGSLFITSPTGGREEDYFSIRLEDDVCGERILEIELPYAEFAKALATRCGAAQFTIYSAELVGARRENMTVAVKSATTQKAALKPHLVNGWRYMHGYGNHHRHNYAEDTYACAFVRYIGEDGKPIQ